MRVKITNFSRYPEDKNKVSDAAVYPSFAVSLPPAFILLIVCGGGGEHKIFITNLISFHITPDIL